MVKFDKEASLVSSNKQDAGPAGREGAAEKDESAAEKLNYFLLWSLPPDSAR